MPGGSADRNRGANVTFWGVRGSTPCEGPQYARYGGHSSCVVLEAAGADPIVFDLGTGVRPYGQCCSGGAYHGTVLLTHLHWDHVQGLPFFEPLHRDGSSLDIVGPRQAVGSLSEAFEGMMCPPYFPVRPRDLGGELRWHEAGDDAFMVGGARVRSRWVRHVGPTLGYRVEVNGVSVVYISDHGPGCCPQDADDHVPDAILELCDGADLLIHDAQHTAVEYEAKRHWGHCTDDYALHVARAAGVRRLALFHHDPGHGDTDIDRIAQRCADQAARGNGPEVFAAAEGMVLALDPRIVSPV